MKRLICHIALLHGLVLTAGCISPTDASIPVDKEASDNSANGLHFEQIKNRAKKAEVYCLENQMNTDICLLADMSLHSGKKRMVVWDFRKDTIVASGLVSHGCGNHPWGKDFSKSKPAFSNTPDSHCSSAGKYKIGERGYSQWGIHVKYLMHGLEAGNSHALSREIVLHGWDAIADEETYPAGTPEGWGCPAVSNNFMTLLDPMLKTRKKPVLLWIYL